MPLVVFDYFFPGSVDTHGGLVIFWLIISFIGYLYSIFGFVKTKEFAGYEKNSNEREKEFYKVYKAHLWKISKICVAIDIPLLLLTFYALIKQFVLKDGMTIINYVPVVCVFFNIFLYVFFVLLKKNT